MDYLKVSKASTSHFYEAEDLTITNGTATYGFQGGINVCSRTMQFLQINNGVGDFKFVIFPIIICAVGTVSSVLSVIFVRSRNWNNPHKALNIATYFATGSHGADNCTEWEAGECSNYAYALNHITKRLNVDYYKEFFREQKGLKIESVIEKAAQDYYEAYYPYYKDAKPLIYENNGEGLYMENHYAIGTDDSGKVVDDVYVVFIDKDGNYYEPMSFEVPNYFK